MSLKRFHPSPIASVAFFGAAFLAWSARIQPAAAAPTKVACVGEQTTHSDQLSRAVEYPAMLQTKLGAGYDVQNFGDCCSTVLYGYPRQGEIHPYLSGQPGITPLDANGMPLMPGYQLGVNPSYVQSLPFGPDVVVIGSWGKHDTEIANALYAGALDRVKWQADYERLATTYLNLPNKPTVYVSTPLPIPSGQPVGVTTTVILPAIQAVAAQYHLKIVPLYEAFLNQPQLYKDATHPTNGPGLQLIADTVYATLTGMQTSTGDGGGSAAEAGSGSIDDAGSSTDGAGGGIPPGPTDDGGTALEAGGGPPVGRDAGGSSSLGATPPGQSANSAGCACAVVRSKRGALDGAGALLSGALALAYAVRRRATDRRGSS